MGVVAALLLCVALGAARGHRCVHDAVVEAGVGYRESRLAALRASANVSGAQLEGLGRGGVFGGVHLSRSALGAAQKSVASSSWHFLRARSDFVSLGRDPKMDAARVGVLQGTIVPQAMARLQKLYQVHSDPTASLFAHRSCVVPDKSQTPWRCREFEPAWEVECGALGVEEGVNLTLPADYLGAQRYYPEGSSGGERNTGGGSGVTDADVVFRVTAVETEGYCAQDGELTSTVAFALSCQRNAQDRPTFGRLNFCPAHIPQSTSDAVAVEDMVRTAMHEMHHALGFSSSSFPLFRSPLDPATPQTPRDSRDPASVASAYVQQFQCGGKEVAVAVPSKTTVGYAEERGFGGGCGDARDVVGQGGAKNCIARLVAGSVGNVTKAHFGCGSLRGAEIENQPTSSCSLVGSHWEQRVFAGEMMTAVRTHASILSSVTLAAMESSGWYRAVFENADAVGRQRDFGVGMGCGFARDETCLLPASSPLPAVTLPWGYYDASSASNTGKTRGVRAAYCVQGGVDECTFDRRAVGRCSVGTFSSPLPPQFRYWTADSTKGGSYAVQADYCPLPQPYSNTLCENPSHTSATARLSGQFHGKRSRCLASSLVHIGYSLNPTPKVGCFKTSCVPCPTCPNAWRLDVLLPRDCASQPASNPSSLTPSERLAKRFSRHACRDGNSTIPAPTRFSGTIACPDPEAQCLFASTPAPTPGFLTPLGAPAPWGPAGVVAVEAGESVKVSVRRSGGVEGAASVSISLQEGLQTDGSLLNLGTAQPATQGTDFDPGTKILTWNDGEEGTKTATFHTKATAFQTKPAAFHTKQHKQQSTTRTKQQRKRGGGEEEEGGVGGGGGRVEEEVEDDEGVEDDERYSSLLTLIKTLFFFDSTPPSPPTSTSSPPLSTSLFPSLPSLLSSSLLSSSSSSPPRVIFARLHSAEGASLRAPPVPSTSSPASSAKRVEIWVFPAGSLPQEPSYSWIEDKEDRQDGDDDGDDDDFNNDPNFQDDDQLCDDADAAPPSTSSISSTLLSLAIATIALTMLNTPQILQ